MKKTIIFLILISFILDIKVFAKNIDNVENIDTTSCVAHDTVVHTFVEKNAKFQDGDILKFRTYVMMNLRYPLEANINKYQGKSYIRFVVNWDGQVKDVIVYKSSGYKILDDEAVRVVNLSPVWTSAKNDNICVPQQFFLPIEFKALGKINK